MFAYLLIACQTPTPADTDGTDPQIEPVCIDYWAAQALQEATWTAGATPCEPGTIDSQGVDNALAHINFMRELAGKPAFTLDPGLTAAAQQTAELMHANTDIEHEPPDTWECYTEARAEAAGRSLLATTPGVEAVHLYMIDFGNALSLVHRRWLLSDWIDTVGLGSTNEYSAIDLGSTYVASEGWTAWPPPGKMPLLLTRYDGRTTLDTEGWSIQSDDLDFTEVEVIVTGPDGVLDVGVSELRVNNGSLRAIKILPQGWSTEQGSYRVQVPALEIDYTTEFVRCPRP